MLRKLLFFALVTLVTVSVSLAIVGYYYATKYPVKVNVLKQNIGKDTIETNNELDFGRMTKTSEKTKYITASNKSNVDVYIYVYVNGEVGRFTKISKGFFALKANDSRKIRFSMKIPSSLKDKSYRGKAYIIKIPKFLNTNKR